MKSRIDKLISFLKKIEQFKTIERKVFYLKPNRAESDAEHTWHMAMFIILFQRDLPKNLDFLKMLKMALIHDLVEIYAGDTFLFDVEAMKSQIDREKKAAKKLFTKLPEDLNKEFSELFFEFEDNSTEEAKYVKAFDKLQPILQNILSGGYSWKKNKITQKLIDEYKRKYMGHDKIVFTIYKKLLKEIKDKKLAEIDY